MLLVFSFNPLAGIFYCLTMCSQLMLKMLLFQSPCGDFLLPDTWIFQVGSHVIVFQSPCGDFLLPDLSDTVQGHAG